MDEIKLESDSLGLRLIPAFGARIISLIDRRTGRDWIAAGLPVGSRDNDATFGPQTATGWDECFPTVAPCLSTDGFPLRDHGDLWGRPWIVTSANRQSVTTLFNAPGYQFQRTLLLEGNSLLCSYLVSNPSKRPLEFLWAMHALFALTQQDRIELPGGTQGIATFRNDGKAVGAFAWPLSADFPLSAVQPAEKRFAAKLLFDDARAMGVRINGAEDSLLIEAQKPFAGAIGLWLCYGGWPGARWVHQVAIEPTNAPADDLAAARKLGRATLVPPGQSVSWWTRLTVGPP